MAVAATLQPMAPTMGHPHDNVISNELGSLSEDKIDQILSERIDSLTLPASKLLIESMIATLRSLGYGKEATTKVFDRFEKNIVEARDIFAETHLHDLDYLSERLSDELLNKEKLRERGIHLNSNEPVLLLDVPHTANLSTLQIRNLKENLHIMMLSRGIRPVRIYVRLSQSLQASEFGFCFCLLNVVNTDIGGPSMIQLLDAAFYGEGWKNYLIMKEAYDGNNRLWQDEAWVSGVQKEQAVLVQSAPLEDETLESLPQVEAKDSTVDEEEPAASQPSDIAERTETAKEVATPSLPMEYKDINSAPDDSDDDEPEKEEHPAMKELREHEAARAAVRHPSWTRDYESQGLLDIITTQSTGVKGEPISVISRPSDDTSDDFEVVEKI